MKTKLDHIYGITGTGDITALQNQVNTINTNVTNMDNRLTSLSNIAAKTNVANTFTSNQTINGQVKADSFKIESSNKRIVTEMLDYNNKKYGRIVFQDGGNNRLIIQHNFNDNVNELIGGNVRVGTPSDNSDIANKQYVDNKFLGDELLTWTGNIQTTELTWNRASQFSSGGTYFLIARIKANNKHSFIYEMFKIDSQNDTAIGNVNLMNYENLTTSSIQTLPTASLCLAYEGGRIRIIRYGSGHPTNAEIKVFFRKVN